MGALRNLLDAARARPGPIAATLVAVVVLGWLGRSTVRRLYLEPKAAVLADIAETRSRLERAEASVARAPEQSADEAAVFDRTLGDDVESVDHVLRSELNRIAEIVGLDGATVSTGLPATRSSPARSAFPRRGPWRELRDEPDFVEIEGALAGEGTFEQVLEVLDRIDAEPWIKRVTSVRIDPKAKGERFAVAVRLATLYVPGRAPRRAPVGPYDPTRLERYAVLAGANPFRIPEPAAVEATPPPPSGPPPFPWEQWSLTGVAEGPAGPEAWLLDRASGTARRLAVGQSIEDAVLAAAGGDWAEFRRGDDRFRVQVGRNLNDRVAVSE